MPMHSNMYYTHDQQHPKYNNTHGYRRDSDATLIDHGGYSNNYGTYHARAQVQPTSIAHRVPVSALRGGNNYRHQNKPPARRVSFADQDRVYNASLPQRAPTQHSHSHSHAHAPPAPRSTPPPTYPAAARLPPAGSMPFTLPPGFFPYPPPAKEEKGPLSKRLKKAFADFVRDPDDVLLENALKEIARQKGDYERADMLTVNDATVYYKSKPKPKHAEHADVHRHDFHDVASCYEYRPGRVYV
ncbi:hypothetical protein DFH11DRAFT_1542819 [Phellopilus nigrolimitatus]|nr:hypothetical protein DFH11DRAFT_1542819 [Phellopilus nigrolimitatus]